MKLFFFNQRPHNVARGMPVYTSRPTATALLAAAAGGSLQCTHHLGRHAIRKIERNHSIPNHSPSSTWVKGSTKPVHGVRLEGDSEGSRDEYIAAPATDRVNLVTVTQQRRRRPTCVSRTVGTGWARARSSAAGVNVHIDVPTRLFYDFQHGAFTFVIGCVQSM